MKIILNDSTKKKIYCQTNILIILIRRTFCNKYMWCFRHFHKERRKNSIETETMDVFGY